MRGGQGRGETIERVPAGGRLCEIGRDRSRGRVGEGRKKGVSLVVLLVKVAAEREVISQKELPSPKGSLVARSSFGKSLRVMEELEAQCTGKAAFQLHSRPSHSSKVTTHALPWIDKAGGIDEYLLKTPYQEDGHRDGTLLESQDREDVCFSSPEDEAKFAEGIAKKAARREARRKMYGWSGKPEQIEDGKEDDEGTYEELVANT
ncbi:hypothetical protein RJ639_024331 [Escallonia herrerae]|uniref:Uncharacterized protein n=1 Tax=Escallonia herrerae TaxID=1293975 RepID=A0AA89AEQ6_9ASTE|nr:hypothetical protein RJ639_024331 [Escallonia herrerae]